MRIQSEKKIQQSSKLFLNSLSSTQVQLVAGIPFKQHHIFTEAYVLIGTQQQSSSRGAPTDQSRPWQGLDRLPVSCLSPLLVAFVAGYALMANWEGRSTFCPLRLRPCHSHHSHLKFSQAYSIYSFSKRWCNYTALAQDLRPSGISARLF